MFLAGVPVADARVLELARRLEDAQLAHVSEKLEHAWRGEVKVLALDVPDREAILGCSTTGRPGLPNCAPCCSKSTSPGFAMGSSSR